MELAPGIVVGAARRNELLVVLKDQADARFLQEPAVGAESLSK